MGLYEKVGLKLGFKHKPFFYISIFCMVLMIIVAVWGILYDIPESMKPKVCFNYIQNRTDYKDFICGYCDMIRINRTLEGGIFILNNDT